MMKAQSSFYICPTCFTPSESTTTCHGRTMIKYDASLHTGDQRKPIIDEFGRLKSQAPRWFLDAVRGRQAVVGVVA